MALTFADGIAAGVAKIECVDRRDVQEATDTRTVGVLGYLREEFDVDLPEAGKIQRAVIVRDGGCTRRSYPRPASTKAS